MIDMNAIHSVRITDLKPRPNNRNRHPEGQIDRLAKIIARTGFRRPIIVSTLSGWVVCGHGRLQAAKKAGLLEVPVIYQNYENEDLEYADHVADNALQTWSDLDLAGVALDIENMGSALDLDFLGLRQFQLESLGSADTLNHWVGMPEFNQADKNSFRHVIVHFPSEKDVQEFFKAIGQNDTGTTKSVWFPPQERMDTESKRYE